MTQENRIRNSLYRVYFRIHQKDQNVPWTNNLPLQKNNNRFRMDVPWLTISKNDYLVAIDGNSLLKLSDEQLLNILGKKRTGINGEGDDVHIDIIANPDDEFLNNLLETKKLPRRTNLIVCICHKCPEGFQITRYEDTKHINNWSRHVSRNIHPPPASKKEGSFNKSTKCDICGHEMKENWNLQNHMDSIHGFGFLKEGLNDDDFETFVYKSPNDVCDNALRRLALQMSCHDRYVLSYTGKFAFNNLFPFLFPTGGQRKINWDNIGNSSEATFDLIKVLEEAYRRDCEYVLLYKRIKIVDRNQKILYYLSQNMTLPAVGNKNFEIKQCEDDPNQVKVSLIAKPKPFTEEPSLADLDDLLVYGDFKRGPKFNHNPHCYSIEDSRNGNMFFCPWLFPALHLRHMTGVDCVFFWRLCDRIRNVGLQASHGMSVPSKIALFLIRQRQGTSFYFLEDLLLIERKVLSDIFYEVLFMYKSLWNHQYAIWNQRELSDEAKDQIYEAYLC